ncbi:MAG: hypothetical protein U0452_03820 [Anaerolineae bacterium]
MFSEMDMRLLFERSKELERAAREHRVAREATAKKRQNNRRVWARLVALFL